MTNELTGSTALVTGGNSGIGRATALALGRLGAHVVLSGRDASRGQQVVTDIRAEGGQADFVQADLADEASARHLARAATELGGGHVDILVNNAGIFRSARLTRSAKRTSTASTRSTSRHRSSWSPN